MQQLWHLEQESIRRLWLHLVTVFALLKLEQCY